MGLHLGVVAVARNGDHVDRAGRLTDQAVDLEHHRAGGVDHRGAALPEAGGLIGRQAMGPDDGDVVRADLIGILENAHPAAFKRGDDLGIVDDRPDGQDAFAGVFLAHLEGQVERAPDPEAEAGIARHRDLHA